LKLKRRFRWKFLKVTRKAQHCHFQFAIKNVRIWVLATGISLQFAKSQRANQAKPGQSDKSPTVNCEYKMFSLTK
jgi:hypothetical protein